MTENVNLRCPLIWAAVLIEAQADGDVERAAMAMDELRRLAGDELTDDFLKGYDDGTKV